MDGTAARLLMLTSMSVVQRLRGANSSRYTAAETPSGNTSSSVTTSVRNEPTTAPQTPASSGSRESPDVRKRVLKTSRKRPSARSRSIHAIWASESRRSDSGVSREMRPRR